MKSVSILISNFNSEEAIQLAIESVQKYTKYPHKIIIYDDASTNKIDVSYLSGIWGGNLLPIWGCKRVNHGGAINKLLANCGTDLAMILDNDIQILELGWLEEMVKLMEDEKIILASGIEELGSKTRFNYWFQSWFMMLNMQAYQDGMEVDWLVGKGKDGTFMPTGARLYQKIMNENPRGYRIASIPKSVKKKFYHHTHISMLFGNSGKNEQQVRAKRLAVIKAELRKLRATQ